MTKSYIKLLTSQEIYGIIYVSHKFSYFKLLQDGMCIFIYDKNTCSISTCTCNSGNLKICVTTNESCIFCALTHGLMHFFSACNSICYHNNFQKIRHMADFCLISYLQKNTDKTLPVFLRLIYYKHAIISCLLLMSQLLQFLLQKYKVMALLTF